MPRLDSERNSRLRLDIYLSGLPIIQATRVMEGDSDNDNRNDNHNDANSADTSHDERLLYPFAFAKAAWSKWTTMIAAIGFVIVGAAIATVVLIYLVDKDSSGNSNGLTDDGASADETKQPPSNVSSMTPATLAPTPESTARPTSCVHEKLVLENCITNTTCGECLNDVMNSAYNTTDMLTCFSFETIMCQAIYQDCEECRGCEQEAEDYYHCGVLVNDNSCLIFFLRRIGPSTPRALVGIVVPSFTRFVNVLIRIAVQVVWTNRMACCLKVRVKFLVQC